MAKEYIEREAAIQYFKKRSKAFIGHDPIPPALVIMGCANELDAIPAADVVEVVRCGECKHRDPEDKKCDCGHDILWQLPRQDDWFCADGERREVQEADRHNSQACDTCPQGAHWDGVVICGKDGQRHERNETCKEG